MSATTTTTGPTAAVTRDRRIRTEPLTRPTTTRLVRVELRKMFDTRAGLWLCASVVILSVIATGVVIAVAPDSAQTFATFATAIGAPINIVLPMIAILSITSEWSQRSGLGSFTMVPQRGRVLGAKTLAIAVVGVVSMVVALGVGAVGTLLGSAITGLPPLSGTLAAFQGWWRDLQPWLDLQHAQTRLFDGWPGGTEWLHLLVASLPWLVLPLALGLWLVSRSEVK